VILRHLLALLSLLLAVACTQGGTPPQTASAGVQGSGAPALPPDIEKAVGPAYAAPALRAYVDRVGQKLVVAAKLPGSYRFYVLDQPLANAHALPSGYIFVTRGLLALLDDEAELAAALAHELGHLAQGHATQRERQRQTAINAAIEAARVTGSLAVARSVALDQLVALRRYSRDQELAADSAGVGYVVQAGYRAGAMASLIEKLQRQARLEALFFDRAPETAGRRSAFSTHPAPDERLVALRALVVAPGAAGLPDDDATRAAYFAEIDGMSVDDAPDEGFVRGRAFLHPALKLAFRAPPGFRLFNDHDGVLALSRGGDVMYFSCEPAQIPGTLIDWMRDNVKPTPTDVQPTRIGGAEAAIGARPRGSDTGLSQVRYVVIRREPGVCYFNLVSDGPDRDRRIETMVAATRSFHILTDAEAAALRPYLLHVVSPAGATPGQLAARLPYPDFKLNRLLTLNGVDDSVELARRPLVKTVVP
jgi:predicted Zn-dependent protease